MYDVCNQVILGWVAFIFVGIILFTITKEI